MDDDHSHRRFLSANGVCVPQSGCEQGRVPGGVRFEITDDQVWEQYTADGSTLLPSFLDKHSGCKVAEKGVTKCSEDRKSTIICTEDHRDGSRYQGLLNWIPTECSAGLTCRMTTVSSAYDTRPRSSPESPVGFYWQV